MTRAAITMFIVCLFVVLSPILLADAHSVNDDDCCGISCCFAMGLPEQCEIKMPAKAAKTKPVRCETLNNNEIINSIFKPPKA
ncbi:MAG: hypothetical protein FWD16_03000 [Clostridia bacterium]|nr:hypothetical protein [Clostridia bacterium]